MVRLTLVAYTKARSFRHRQFLDSLRIYVKAGAGGMGFPKYGGMGGKGGDVYVQAAADDQLTLKDVVRKTPSKRIIATNGGNSRVHRILGEIGQDATILCPMGVRIFSETGHLLGELNKKDDRILVAKGGTGGNAQNQFNGQKGQCHSITFDLKLIADVGLLGFPNAGKSSLLKAISKARPRIANFPFTTLCPQLGILEYEDMRQISMADLPGVIEGAHDNVGLGHKFLKHVERTKILLFVVDITGFRLSPKYPRRTPFEMVMLLNKELELYRDDLTEKPAILVVNKIDDMENEKTLSDLIEEVKNAQEATRDWDSEVRPNKFVDFDDIVPISARTGENVGTLKQRIRELIDFHAEIKMETNPEIRSISVLVKNQQDVAHLI